MVKQFNNVHSDKDWRSDIPIRVRQIKSQLKTLRRFMDESLRLEKHGELANSKGEWGRGGGLVRHHTGRTN